MDTDKVLYSEFLYGNQEAFESLVIRHRHHFVKFLVTIVKSDTIAEDVAQDVFAYIYVKPERYDDTYAFKTYLYMLGKRRAIDVIRKEEKRKEFVRTESVCDDAQSLSDYIAQMEALERLMQHVQDLEEPYRQVIRLVYLDEYSIRETAQVLNKSEGAIKVMLYRARKRLKKMMMEGEMTHENGS